MYRLNFWQIEQWTRPFNVFKVLNSFLVKIPRSKHFKFHWMAVVSGWIWASSSRGPLPAGQMSPAPRPETGNSLTGGHPLPHPYHYNKVAAIPPDPPYLCNSPYRSNYRNSALVLFIGRYKNDILSAKSAETLKRCALCVCRSKSIVSQTTGGEGAVRCVREWR